MFYPFTIGHGTSTVTPPRYCANVRRTVNRERRVSGNMSRDGSRVGNCLMEGELDRFGHAQAEASATEPVWSQATRPGQDGVAFGLDYRSRPLVHLVGSEVVQLAVHVLSVVPGHEGVHVGSGLLDVPEVLRKRRPPLEGREQALDEGVVVADVGPAVGVADLEAFEIAREAGRSHGASVVGMDPQSARVRDPLGDDPGEQILGQLAVLGKLNGPADGLAAEQVLDGVEVEVGSPHRGRQVGDVPGPDLVHLRGFQNRRAPLW